MKRPSIFWVATTVALTFTCFSYAADLKSASAPEPLVPLGEAKGIHPGRVVWIHDPAVSDWQGPGHGHWWEDNHTRQPEVNLMVSQSYSKINREGDRC